jgi:hypothetical protein
MSDDNNDEFQWNYSYFKWQAALKDLVATLLNADPKEAGVWTEVLTKQVGSRIARVAFDLLVVFMVSLRNATKLV